MPRVTAIYAALLALLYLALSLQVIRERHRTQVALGTGGDPQLERAARVHANFAEYGPFALLLILLAELLAAPGWWLNLLGLALLAGRSLHAYGVSQAREKLRFRMVGMAMTFSVLALGSLTLLWAALLR